MDKTLTQVIESLNTQSCIHHSLALHEFCLNKLSPEFKEKNNTYKPLKSLKGVRILSPTLSSSIMT